LCSFLLFDLLPPISLCFFLIWHPEGYLDLINHLRLELLKICVHTSTFSSSISTYILNKLTTNCMPPPPHILAHSINPPQCQEWP
jgi:hypothetical protein